jgi:hypothetical protein
VPLSLLIVSVVLWVLTVAAVVILCAAVQISDRELAREKQPPRAIL